MKEALLYKRLAMVNFFPAYEMADGPPASLARLQQERQIRLEEGPPCI